LAKETAVRHVDDLYTALAESDFRSRQKLGKKDRRYLDERSLTTLMTHAGRFVVERLAPADPAADGKQTPMRGHPVFVGQHATATCCRGCLAKWHGIPKGRPLTDAEIEHVLAVLRRWLIAQGAKEKALPLFPGHD
jgi:Domain of unknown function (DUF4186)